MLSTVHISAGNASKRLETKCLPDIPSLLQYFTGRKEWSETYLGKTERDLLFSPLGFLLACLWQAEQRAWTDSLQLQTYASNISLSNCIILWFFSNVKKKKRFSSSGHGVRSFWLSFCFNMQTTVSFICVVCYVFSEVARIRNCIYSLSYFC